MTSSMLAGERRWTSARRGGMTVLGKVSAPKPLNLPSQRLENHGLDPNVEIVPKGSLSWGSCSSSSSSNAWGSSALSPNADGGSGSPSHPSGRPSSGGNSSRPSTAGSDRMHEPTASTWGPNSRPSSASGALTSNQTSLTSLRPRSAETRPSSAQLSRFAESTSDNSVAWGPSSTLEKLGVASSKNDGFSLSSGDFPTLGSEIDNSGKNTESHDVKSETVNNWKRGGTQHIEDGVQPSSEKWQGEPQQFLNANGHPQHFDTWHGPPINAPAGVWYRGPSGGPPYGPSVAPGGFPIEPFPYYRPALVNSQPVPLPGAGPRGHHPKNGDLYRPQMPDGYIRPGMPISPGFYPGTVAFEGYYGPPMGYCNSSERYIPFMGIVACPSVYNRYSAQNAPEPCNTHARAGGHAATGKELVSEQVESDHSEDSRGPYRVLMKQHTEWGANEEEENWEHSAPADALCLEKGEQARTASWKNEWGADNRTEDEMYSRRTLGEDSSSRNFDNRDGYSLESILPKPSDNMGNTKAVDDGWSKRSEITESSFPEVPQVLPASPKPKDSTLIKKIEGFNAKARASDGGHDVASASSREEQKNRLDVVNTKTSTSMNEVGTVARRFGRTCTTGGLIHASHKAGISTRDTTLQSTVASETAISRGAYHGVQGRIDHRVKGRFNNQDADGWRKKSLVTESFTAFSAANAEPASSVHPQDHHPSEEAAENSEINLPGKDEGESLTPMFDPGDCQAQHSKMRELAKQRAIELQKEEEERIREQKAKALAKLDDLNRCTQAGDGSTQKLEKVPPSGAIQREQEESLALATKYEAPTSALVSKPSVVTQTSESSVIGVGESIVLSRDSHLDAPKNAQEEPVVPLGQYLPVKLDVLNAGAADCKAGPQVNDGSLSRHNCMGHKQKQDIPVEKNTTEKLIPMSTTEAPKNPTDRAVNDIASSEVVPGEVGSSYESSSPVDSNIMFESSAHQRRKNNRSGKSKHKLDDASPLTALPSPVPKEINLAKASTESGKAKASQLELDPSSVQSGTAVKDAIQPSDQHCSSPSKEGFGRVNNQWKSQHPRRITRNPQANRLADKFHSSDTVIWASVGSHNKAEPANEAIWKTVTDAVINTAKSDNLVQNSLKSKRAEMERYVPKPVAKELAQQGSIQQPMSSSFGQSTSDETAGGAELGFQSTEMSQPAILAIGNVGYAMESKNGDRKQNKQAKAHGARRQRGSTESPDMQGLQQGSSTSNPNRSVQKPIDQHESSKPDVNSVKAELQFSDEWNTYDGWNIPNNSTAAAPVTSVVKDQGGVTGKGKRHPSKGHRSMGNNHDLGHKNVDCGETDKSCIQAADLEMSQKDRLVTLKENRGSFGERTSSHWQPKSQAYSANNQRGNRSSGSQNVAAEVGKAIKKDSPPRGRVHLPPHQDNESSEVIAHPHLVQPVTENTNMAEAPYVGHQEARRERKLGSFKGRTHSPNHGLVSTEPAPLASTDGRLEQRFSGFCRNGNQDSRSGRVHESHGDWSSSGQDNRQHNVPASANRERHRHNSHYEYQPVRSYNNSKPNNIEALTDGSPNIGSRYRERGPGCPRRGGENFYGRQSGTVQVDAAYN